MKIGGEECMHAWVDMTVVKGTMQREAATRDAEGRLLESGGLKLHRAIRQRVHAMHRAHFENSKIKHFKTRASDRRSAYPTPQPVELGGTVS